MDLEPAGDSHGRASTAHAAGTQLRADARRNRETLVTVARAAFGAAEDKVPLEEVARRANVGIGTLYRHFPTREALVEAVYAAELDDVATSAPLLLEQHQPDIALRVWMDRYAEFIATKRGMLDTLRAGWASGRMATPTTRARITTTIGTVLSAGASAGVLRDDIEPEDVTAMLLGVFLSTAASGTPEQTGRMLDLLVDSLRPRG